MLLDPRVRREAFKSHRAKAGSSLPALGDSSAGDAHLPRRSVRGLSHEAVDFGAWQTSSLMTLVFFSWDSFIPRLLGEFLLELLCCSRLPDVPCQVVRTHQLPHRVTAVPPYANKRSQLVNWIIYVSRARWNRRICLTLCSYLLLPFFANRRPSFSHPLLAKLSPKLSPGYLSRC